jgi:hypothetical protein
MAGWECGNTGCFHSTPVTIYAGDSIATNLVGYSSWPCAYTPNNNCWSVGMNNVTRGTSTTYQTHDNRVYRWLTGGAVEVYGLTSCNHFPNGGVQFKGILATQFASPSWSAIPLFGSWQTPSWGTTIQGSPNPSCNYAVQAATDPPWYWTSTVALQHYP